MSGPKATPPSPTAPHLGPVLEERRGDRDRFAAGEAVIVLSHFDLGVIRSAREYPRGSRRSPKLRIAAERGEYLLKRRAPGRDDPDRVAFAQDLQRCLEQRGYPVPGLIPTRSRHATMLRLGDRVYEMFRFVRGTRDDRSPADARTAGAALGDLHRLLADYRPVSATSGGSYHDAAGMDAAWRGIPDAVANACSHVNGGDLVRCCAYLAESYREAVERVRACGLDEQPHGVIHGDWHPGNLLFREGRIVAVLDFDSARVDARILDVANAALQFSMTMAGPDDPGGWPEHLDVKRIRALLSGYHHGYADGRLGSGGRTVLPWLMLEALVMESVVPIAATGRFAHLRGDAFLRMVERKVRWLRPRATKIATYLEA